MTASTRPFTNIEYRLLFYVPNVLCDQAVSIATFAFSTGDLKTGLCGMVYEPGWRSKVRVLDADADLEMLEALLSEIRDRLLSPSQRSDMIHQLEDSFSNIIQISQKREWTLAANPDAIKAFARALVEMSSSPRTQAVRYEVTA